MAALRSYAQYSRHVDRHQLPPDRTVVQFDFRDPASRSAEQRRRAASQLAGPGVVRIAD